MGRRVFVSYSRSDRRLAHQLVKQLKSGGHLVWIDEAGPDAGEAWAQEVVEAIRTSQVLVLLATTASVKSKNVKEEVEVAGRFGIPIVPAIIPPARVPARINSHISNRHRVTIDPDRAGGGFAALAVGLDEVRPTGRQTPRFVPSLALLSFAALVGLGMWTAVSGAFPPWSGRPTCELVSAAIVATSPARLGTLAGGAVLDIEVQNRADRVITLPPPGEATASGASGRQYSAESPLANTSWVQPVDVEPGTTVKVQLGLSNLGDATDVVSITIRGVRETAFPFLECDFELTPVEVTFAGG